MTLLPWIAAGAGVLLAIVWVIVPFVTRPATLEGGEAPAVFSGALLSFTLIAGLLFAVNPDHLTALRSRTVEAAVLAAVAAVVWLPVYLVAVKGRIRGRRDPE